MENRRSNKWELLGLPTEEEVKKSIETRDEAAIERFDFGKIPASGMRTENNKKYRFWVEQGGVLQEVSWIGPAGGKQKDRHMPKDMLGNQLASETTDRFETEEQDEKRLLQGLTSPTYRAMRSYNNALEDIANLPLQAKAQRRNKLLARQLGEKYEMLFQEIIKEDDETTLNNLAQSDGWDIYMPSVWAYEIQQTVLPPQEKTALDEPIPLAGIRTEDTSQRYWIEKNGLWREVDRITPLLGQENQFNALDANGDIILQGLQKGDFFVEYRDKDRLENGRGSYTFQALNRYLNELATLNSRLQTSPQTRNQELRDSVLAEFQRLVDDLWQHGEIGNLGNLMDGRISPLFKDTMTAAMSESFRKFGPYSP